MRELSVADCGAQFADCLCVLRVRAVTCSAAVTSTHRRFVEYISLNRVAQITNKIYTFIFDRK